MFIGAPDDLIQQENKNANMATELSNEVKKTASRTYNGRYSREEMAIALTNLVLEDNRINCAFLVKLIENASEKLAYPVTAIKAREETKKIYVRASEVNALLRTFVKIELLTFDFLQDRILWVCQEQPSGSFYSCLTILPSPHSIATQLYFTGRGEEMARDFLKAFAANTRLNGRNSIYLKEVTKIPGGLNTTDLVISKPF